MWPWGHLALGYLVYSLVRRRQGQLPEHPEVYLLGIGALLPDLVDKPLAWTFGVLESGRSLGHSALVAVIVVGVLYLALAPRFGRQPVVAFGIGYLTHPMADLPYNAVLAGEFEFLHYFVWPLLAVPTPESDISLITYLLSYEPGLTDWVQLGLVVLALGLWRFDGSPGWAALRQRIRVGLPPDRR